jgi:hypothetical protein
MNSEIARRVAEKVVQVVYEAYRSQESGKLLREIDQLFADLIIPDKHSNTTLNILYNALQEKTPYELLEDPTSLPSIILEEIRVIMTGEYYLLAKEQMVDTEVAVVVLFELTLGSPLFDIVFNQYEDAESQPTVS